MKYHINRAIPSILLALAVGSAAQAALKDETSPLTVRFEVPAKSDRSATSLDLLQAAFLNAADRNAWIGDYSFAENTARLSSEGASVAFDIVNWEKGSSGLYECSVIATYTNNAGETIDLGRFFGLKAIAAKPTPDREVELFTAAAADAIAGAIDELYSKLNRSE